MLGVLRAVKWERAPEVTPIEPQGHEALSFFPGQRGYDGPVFPVGGLMLVANNFDNLTNWLTYKAHLAAEDTTQSFARLRDYIIPASGRNFSECWLTNYCLGVMDMPNSQYPFPAATRRALEFETKFDAMVAIMRPRLIVAMGGLAAECLKAKREPSLRGDTRIIAIDHPGRWHKGPKYFKAEGMRIRDAWEAAPR